MAGKNPLNIVGHSLFREFDYESGKEIPAEPKIKAGDAFDLIYLCRCWFLWASGKPVPTRNVWDSQLWKWDYNRTEDKLPWDDWCRSNIIEP